jgi:hypothetical protein
MNKKKTAVKYCIIFGIVFGFVTLFAACKEPFSSVDNSLTANGYGRVNVLVEGGQARTVMPSTVFDKYVYTFTKTDGASTAVNPINGYFTMEAGNYTVEVKAYIGKAEPYTLAASGTSSQFTVSYNSTATIKVPLQEVSSGQGEFTYTITYPDGADAVITLKKWPSLNVIALNPSTKGNVKTQTLTLDTGSYMLSVVVSNGMGISEAIHIYPLRSTEYTKVLTGDFVFNNIPDFAAFLAALPANTAANPYTIKLNVSDLGGSYSTFGSVGYALIANKTKYVNLDLSDSTFATIGSYAFQDCTSLTGITIPDSVTSIVDDVFLGCKSLTAINVDAGNNAYSSQDGVLYNKDKTTLRRYPIGKTGAFTVPESVKKIESDAFRKCTSLTSVTIPSSVTSIGNNAFSECTSLTSVTIPSSVTSIGNNAFSGCTSLTGVTIPNSVTSIGNGAFLACTSLTGITIPNSVTSIGNNAFSGCKSLTSITIPNSVTSIGNNAFELCFSFTSVTIPSSVTSIGYGAFEWSSSLTAINVDSANTAYISENGVLYNKNKTSLHTYPAGKTGSFAIPSSVTNIGQDAFYHCTGLTSVTIPSSVTSIGQYAFGCCTSLTSVTIPKNVTSIGASAFSGCTSLTSVTFASGSNITDANFGDSAFPEFMGGGNTLKSSYSTGKAGTYKRAAGSWVWLKQ